MNLLSILRSLLGPPVATALFLLPLLLGPPGALAAISGDEDPAFADARVARVLGDAMVLDGRDERWRYAEQNHPVERREIYLTGASGELALEFRGGVLVDVGHGTRLEVLNAARGPHLRLDYGSIYLVLLNDRTAYDRVRVAWKGGKLYLGDRGSYRLDRFADGTARAMVLRGRARVRAGGGGRHLEPGEAILIGRSGFASRETSYRPGDYDDFDRAVIDRYTGVFGYRPPRHFPHVLVGFWELDTRGTWLYVPAWRSYCWKPRNPGRGWRPFHAGQWRRTPRGAWTWIPAESWGHVTSHYGAWAYLAGKGWVWKPGRTYNPGRVRWARAGNRLGWAPLGPDGKPAGPAGEKSAFLFVEADKLQSGDAPEPVAAPVPPGAPKADDPGALMPSLAETAAPPDDDAAAEAEAIVKEAAREREERLGETAAVDGLVPEVPEEEVGAPPVAEDPGEIGDDEILPATAPPPEGPDVPLPLAGAGETGVPDAADASEEGGMTVAPLVAGPEEGGGVPAGEPPPDATTVTADDLAPRAEPAADPAVTDEAPPAADGADSKKAVQEAERLQRRAENDAKKARERAARDAERARKAIERTGGPPEAPGAVPGAAAPPAPAPGAPAAAGGSAD